jgi:glycyl-tRNA synthetase
MSQKVSMEDIVSLAKRRGFIFQGSEIYGGLAGTWDWGPLGVQLKRNITNLWWQMFVEDRDDMYGLDAAILMNQKVWQASGHIDTFNDPLIEDIKTKKRYRLDHLLEDNGIDAEGKTIDQMVELVEQNGLKSPDGNDLGSPAQFNLMFKTQIGPVDDEASVSYLRPETAQGIFVNFKNIVDTFYPNLPFGVGQIGKAFRNEISPRDFVFRLREMEQMEIEYFIDPITWEENFEKWRILIWDYYQKIGLPKDMIHEHEIAEQDRAHYSKRTIDFEFDYPFGRKELMGLAYRTDYDLSKHQKYSGKNLEYRPKDGSSALTAHVIEPSMGVERLVLATLVAAYTVDEVNGEKRIYLKLPEQIAPVKYCVSPLLKNKPELVAKAREVYDNLRQKHGAVMWDDNGNIGKRYRRQDEIGTPFCVVIDFDTLEDDSVTVRYRDTTEQKRVKIQDLLK